MQLTRYRGLLSYSSTPKDGPSRLPRYDITGFHFVKDSRILLLRGVDVFLCTHVFI